MAILLPGSASTGCYLWRATTQPVSGRGAALALPLVLIALVLADRLSADKIALRRQVRGWGAVAVVLVAATAWTGLAWQGRSGCASSPAVIGFVVCGGLAALVATHWATRLPAVSPLLGDPSKALENSSEEVLDQSALRAIFLQLTSFTESRASSRPVVVPVLAGSLAAMLLLSTVLPWRELLDPVALGPAGAEAGLIRVQLWEIPYAETWAVLLALAAVAVLCAAVARSLPVLRVLSVLAGALAVAGVLTALVQLPDQLSDGVGYRPAIGAWLALALGLLLLGLGVGARRRQLLAVLVAAAVGVGAGLLAPAAAAPAYKPVVIAGIPHRLLDLEGGQLVDRLGMRVAIGTSDPLDSVAGTLDGTPGQWLLGRTGSEGSTLFEYRDGVAFPRVTLSHGVTPPALLGVEDNKMVLLAGGAGSRPWAILAVPLTLVAADVSLSHKNPDGSYYVTPDIDVLATGQGPALTHRNADRSIVIWGGSTTWQIPADRLRAGLDLTASVVNPGPGAPGNAVSTGPDGTTAWRTSRTGLALVRPGSTPQQVTGVAPAGCQLSRDAASSSLTVDAFAVDVRGNLWLGGSAPTAVVTPDGVLRQLPGGATGVDSIEARPDGSVLLGTSPGGGDQILEITGAAGAAASYPAAAEPDARCDRRTPASGSTQYRVTVVPVVPAVDPPGKVAAGAGTQLALDGRGRLVQVRLPNAAHTWAPDGLGGVWWTVSGRGKVSNEIAVHLVGGVAKVVQDPAPGLPNQRGEYAAAAGDRLVTAISGNLYNFYGPGSQVSRVKVAGVLRPDGLVQLGSGDAAMVLGERLELVSRQGRITPLFGGASSGWPISSTEVAPSQWTTDGEWFAGPDGKLWGYDGSHLVRVEGAGRITTIAGPAQGVPQAADEVTVIGRSLFFALGNDIVRLDPK
ncbi:hypothetical protein [Streptomyces sp. SID13031]|uniref:hypothetical protein n=1 Tax=Streptomyces sp. SID13031 TaxID=2706046 RepID=UPI0013CC75F1|nr:hypothetical protein [Streptomyces sp. SID13031]NEA34496.1 hypothetical protein [Streptomyces sp. SID13031]